MCFCLFLMNPIDPSHTHTHISLCLLHHFSFPFSQQTLPILQSSTHTVQVSLLELEQRAVPVRRRRHREPPVRAPTPHLSASPSPREVADLRVVDVPHVEPRARLVRPVQEHFLRRRHRQHVRVPTSQPSGEPTRSPAPPPRSLHSTPRGNRARTAEARSDTPPWGTRKRADRKEAYFWNAKNTHFSKTPFR